MRHFAGTVLKWNTDTHMMQMTYTPTGGRQWTIFEKHCQTPENMHFKAVFTTTFECRAYAEWEKRTQSNTTLAK